MKERKNSVSHSTQPHIGKLPQNKSKKFMLSHTL